MKKTMVPVRSTRPAPQKGSGVAPSPGKGAPKGAVDKNATPTSPKREFETVILLGPPAHGKSSLADEIALDYARNGRKYGRSGAVWVIDPNRNWEGVPYVTPLWAGIARLDDLLGTDDGEGNLTGLAGMGPGLVIMDDADRYLRHPTQVRHDWMTSFRHFEKDVLIVSRRPQGLPKDAIANADALCLFAMREVYARRYVAEQIGDPNVIAQIPQERYRYLYYRQETGAVKLFQTKQRAVVTRSDRQLEGKR